jgi:hypothetical protein
MNRHRYGHLCGADAAVVARADGGVTQILSPRQYDGTIAEQHPAPGNSDLAVTGRA